MKRESYIRFVLMICAAVLPAFAGSLFAAGTGTLDFVSGWYPAGTNLSVTATPHEYSEFDRWDGSTNGATIQTNTIAFSVNSAMAITAVFRPKLTAAGDVPYWWLASVGITNDFENAVNEDPDGDAFTTVQEYWSGTDPQTNTSYLKIDGLDVVSTNVRLMWSHARVDVWIPPISIQRRASMITGDWEHAWAHSPTNGTNTWVSPLPNNGFFRLCVTNAP